MEEAEAAEADNNKMQAVALEHAGELAAAAGCWLADTTSSAKSTKSWEDIGSRRSCIVAAADNVVVAVPFVAALQLEFSVATKIGLCGVFAASLDVSQAKVGYLEEFSAPWAARIPRSSRQTAACLIYCRLRRYYVPVEARRRPPKAPWPSRRPVSNSPYSLPIRNWRVLVSHLSQPRRMTFFADLEWTRLSSFSGNFGWQSADSRNP